jgi:hypothetical protein
LNRLPSGSEKNVMRLPLRARGPRARRLSARAETVAHVEVRVELGAVLADRLHDAVLERALAVPADAGHQEEPLLGRDAEQAGAEPEQEEVHHVSSPDIHSRITRMNSGARAVNSSGSPSSGPEHHAGRLRDQHVGRRVGATSALRVRSTMPFFTPRTVGSLSQSSPFVP